MHLQHKRILSFLFIFTVTFLLLQFTSLAHAAPSLQVKSYPGSIEEPTIAQGEQLLIRVDGLELNKTYHLSIEPSPASGTEWHWLNILLDGSTCSLSQDSNTFLKYGDASTKCFSKAQSGSYSYFTLVDTTSYNCSGDSNNNTTAQCSVHLKDSGVDIVSPPKLFSLTPKSAQNVLLKIQPKHIHPGEKITVEVQHALKGKSYVVSIQPENAADTYGDISVTIPANSTNICQSAPITDFFTGGDSFERHPGQRFCYYNRDTDDYDYFLTIVTDSLDCWSGGNNTCLLKLREQGSSTDLQSVSFIVDQALKLTITPDLGNYRINENQLTAFTVTGCPSGKVHFEWVRDRAGTDHAAGIACLKAGDTNCPAHDSEDVDVQPDGTATMTKNNFGSDAPKGTTTSYGFQASCPTNGLYRYIPLQVSPSGLVSPTPTPPLPPCAVKIYEKKGCTSIFSAIGDLSTDSFGFIGQLFAILLSISGGIALLLIIRSGYQLMTSQGNPEKVKEARERLTSVFVGLLFLVLSIVILEVIGVDLLNLPGLSK